MANSKESCQIPSLVFCLAWTYRPCKSNHGSKTTCLNTGMCESCKLRLLVHKHELNWKEYHCIGVKSIIVQFCYLHFNITSTDQ